MITLSRNSPIAFVVGAAGFIGSHLLEKLISKDLQIVAVDNFSTGDVDNLKNVIHDKNFHLFSQSISDDLEIDLPRLDYAFFLINDQIEKKEYELSVDKFIKICSKFKPKIVLISSIDLYGKLEVKNHNLAYAEHEIAQYATKHRVNARIIRLASVFGPRMNFFDLSDPMARLLKLESEGNLKRETFPLDFITRSIFINDAIDLLIKTIFHGSTALKIYDGVRPNPLNLSEIRFITQNLLEYERKGFTPTLLPEWPTPNLQKTQKELNWQPSSKLIDSLLQTLSYLKQQPLKITQPQVETMPEADELALNQEINPLWVREAAQREAEEAAVKTDKVSEQVWSLDEEPIKSVSSFRLSNYLIIFIGLILIGFGLIYPAANLVIGGMSLKQDFEASYQAANNGEYNRAKLGIEELGDRMGEISGVLDNLSFVRSFAFFDEYFESTENKIQILDETIEASEHFIVASQSFAGGLNGGAGDGKNPFHQASVEFGLAADKYAHVKSRLDEAKFESGLGGGLPIQLEQLKAQISEYQKLADFGESIAQIISNTRQSETVNKYLVLFEDNTKLVEGGGVIDSYALISFDKGELVNLKTDRIDDSKLNLVEKGLLDEASKEADFVDKSEKVRQFYELSLKSKQASSSGKVETNSPLSGVISLDLDALIRLLEITGPVKLLSGEEVNAQNFTSKVINDAEVELINEVAADVLNKIFFLPQTDRWSKLLGVIGQGADKKHIRAHSFDPKVNLHLDSMSWSGRIQEQSKDQVGERRQFLYFLETNLTPEKESSLNIKKSFNLETQVDEVGGAVSHNLKVNYNYLNSLAESDSGGYQALVKVYLASGSRVTKVLWGDEDLLPNIKTFSDFGRSGYSFNLELKQGESSDLIIIYQDLLPLFLTSTENLRYEWLIIQQPGTEGEKFNFSLKYPKNYSLNYLEGKDEQGLFITSFDLNQDQNIKINLKKN